VVWVSERRKNIAIEGVEDEVLRRMFEPKREEGARGWRKMDNE
jgi:hypothetical protein